MLWKRGFGIEGKSLVYCGEYICKPRVPDLNDYPFIPDQIRVIGLDCDWNLDKDSGNDVKSIEHSDDKLFEEYYSQTPALETNTESEDEDEDIMDVVVPELYEGVALTKLGAKNYVRLFNPITGQIVEPPQKPCKFCGEEMDWKTSGRLIRQKACNYTYATRCAGVSLARREKFESCITATAQECRRADLEWVSKADVTETALEVKTVRSDAGAKQASKNRKFNNIIYSNVSQNINWICVLCNMLMGPDEFTVISEETAKEFIVEMGTHYRSPSVKRNLRPDEIEYIKRKKYKGHYNKDMERVKNQKKGGFTVVGKTATPMELVELAKNSGGVDERMGLAGEWNAKAEIRRLSFNRKKNYEGPRTKPIMKFQHSKDNLIVSLLCLNKAKGNYGENALILWQRGIAEGWVNELSEASVDERNVVIMNNESDSE
ncbi:hypothetical protein HK100_006738 [Physocladia obscura]|uniref:Uncharacterized protein n=1 Tax=Physocladia obscura TaxID=109957 RepID=A0AAD5XB66_9FUNG|nr:hypothetical protein HK100_006738 [Physocladia obscura]